MATINAARVLTVTARMLGTDVYGLDRLALAAPPGSQGLTLLPYLDGERSPNRPDASGVLCGLTSANTTQENLARAAVEAVLCSLADAIDNLADCGITAQRVILIGGAARSPAVRAIAPAIFGVPVTVPEPAEYVALGAARQAAWALSGAAEPPVVAAGGHQRRVHRRAGPAGPRAVRRPARRHGSAGALSRTFMIVARNGRIVPRTGSRSWERRSGAAGGKHGGTAGSSGKDWPVSSDYVPAREDRFSFGIWTVGWRVWMSSARPCGRPCPPNAPCTSWRNSAPTG